MMNAQRFQQVRTDVRRTIGRHTLALVLGLSLLIIALAALRYVAPQAKFGPATTVTKPAPIASHTWPGTTLTGSAYNGRSARTAQVTAPVMQGWAGATLTGSAYNGQLARPISSVVPSSGWPGATLTGSAYHGQADHVHHLVVSSSSWPGATYTGSAYDGQMSYPMRVVRADHSWPGATLTGSPYSGHAHSARIADPMLVASWPGATLMGSAYNGQ